MKKTAHAFALATLAAGLGLFCATASAQHFVIAHPGTTLSADDVREVFRGEKQFAGSAKLAPVENAAQQDEFLSKVLGIDKSKYTSVWTKKAFRDGLTQPPQKGGDAEVLDFVKRTPGAVGYVGTQPSGVTIVEKY